MIDLGPHAVFIVWAYIGVALAVAGLIAYALADAARTTRKLDALQASGVRRRSAGPAA